MRYVPWLLLFWVTPAFADRGYVHTKVPIKVSEPAQRAIIGHDGSRELLILQTEVKASRKTRIVEFMPLPAKPDVSLASEDCFAELAKLVKKHRLHYIQRRSKKRNGGSGKDELVRVVVARQLGPHDVTVTEVKDADAFVEWTRAFFRERELGEPKFDTKLRDVVADYLARDIRFFAFDVIEVGKRKKTIQPLAYAFDSAVIYYPLKVSKLYDSAGTVELFLVTPKELEHGSFGWFTRSNSVAVTAAELAPLHPGLPDLVREGPAKLQAFRDRNGSFDKDLAVCTGYGNPETLARLFFEALSSGEIERVAPLLAAPFAFDRKKVIGDRAELLTAFGEVLAKTGGKSLPVDDSIAIEIDTGLDPLTQISTSQIILDKYRFAPGNPHHDFLIANLPGTRVHLVWLTTGGETVLVVVSRDRDCAWDVFRVVGFSD